MNSISKTIQVVAFVLVTALVVTTQLATRHEEEVLEAFQLAHRVDRESQLIARSLQIGPDGFEPAPGLFEAWEMDEDGSPMWAVFDADGELLFGELDPDVDLTEPTRPDATARRRRQRPLGQDAGRRASG